MQQAFAAGELAQAAEIGDVIDVGVRVDQQRGAQSQLRKAGDDLVDAVAAVDHDRFAAAIRRRRSCSCTRADRRETFRRIIP